MKFYEVTPFAVLLTPEVIEAEARTLTAADPPTSSTTHGMEETPAAQSAAQAAGSAPRASRGKLHS